MSVRYPVPRAFVTKTPAGSGAWNTPLETAAVALEVQGATHAHAADGLDLTSAATIAIADALHGHTAEGLALTTAAWLSINDAGHGHSAENVDLSLLPTLATANASHAHAAGALALSTASDLSVADALHGHAADNVAIAAAGGTAGAAEVWSYVMSNGLTAEQNVVENNRMLRILLAGISGQTAGIGSEVETYYGEDGITPRIVATFDGQGNRVSVVTDGAP